MTNKDEARDLARLQNKIEDVVERLRETAASIEAESRRNISAAVAQPRDMEYHTYHRVAGRVVAEVQTLLFNLPLDSLVSAAGDTEVARQSR